MARENYIGGAWVPARSGATDDVVARDGRGARGGRVERRRRRRRRGRGRGRRLPRMGGQDARDRSEVLHQVADAIEADMERLRELEVANVGKPVGMIEFEMDLTLDNWRFFAGGARFLEGRAGGEYYEDHTSFVRRDPLGVVASIAPWNYPLNMATWKVGPALAAGNTVVLKPSELTPLTALRLAEITADILPPGVLNVVTGQGETRAPRW